MNGRGEDWAADFPLVSRWLGFAWLRSRRAQRIALWAVSCAAVAIAAQAQTFTRLGSLADGNGSNPTILVQGGDGNFYGVCSNSDENSGVIFKMTPTGTLSEVYTFGTFAGAYSLIAGKDGNLYGLWFGDGTPYSPASTKLRDYLFPHNSRTFR